MADDTAETRLDTQVPAIPRFAPGAVLGGRYRLVSELGRGGMGVVYRAADLELRRDVALKIVAESVFSAQARERLLREARTAATLNHPHIVTVHDVGEESGFPFFVMELVQGATLAQVRLFDLQTIVAVMCQLCDALAHAHAHGLVHRDLKPENVLLTGDPPRTVKLADLGLAAPIRGSRLTEAGIIVGTVAYMAPEQAMGESVDARADLYSLGVVLYELLAGRTPFGGDHPLAVISQHVNAPVVPLRAIRPEIPRALEAVILKLLAKAPAGRYLTAGDVRAALAQSLDQGNRDGDEPAPAVAVLDALSRGRLVGRDAELTETREFWKRARQGQSHGVLLSGEPGAGKTRLAREVMTQAALDGAVVLAGACYEYEAATPYLPFAEAFRTWVRSLDDTSELREVCGDFAPQVARLAPEIEARLGPFPERAPLAAHEERLLFFDGVAHALEQLAVRRSALLYVDDLHWADSSTLWLLAHLLRRLRHDRILMMAAYRETELDRSHPLSKVLVDWNRDRLITRIVVRRLESRQTREQLSALLGQAVDVEFAGALHRETEGNPFFVEEMLKALIEQGAVHRVQGRWAYCAPGDLQLPQSVKAAIGRRLDRTSADTVEVLRAAAVLGKTFDFSELMAAVPDRREDGLLDALDEAVAAQLVAVGRDESFAFTHDKIREVLYEELNPIRRRRLHLRTAEGLERRRERVPVPVARLAHHFVEGGDHERGLTYATDAGKEAERLFAYDEAVAAYGRALECAEILGRHDERAALEEAMGQACAYAGNQLPALAHFERALALSTDPIARARLHAQAASSLVVQGDPRGLTYAREALAVLDPSTHPIETANALTIEARFHHLAGRHREAIRGLERAAALASPVPGGPRLGGLAAATLMFTYSYLAGAHQHLGLFADSDTWALRVIAIGAEHRLPAAEAVGHEFLAENAMSTGAWREGLEHVEREREIARRIHARERHAWSHLPAGVCSLHLGDRSRSETELREGFALAQSLGERRLAPLLGSALAIVLAETARSDEARATALQVLSLAEASGLMYLRTEGRRALAHVCVKRGELDEALRLSEEVLRLTAGTEAKVSRLHLGPLHVEALLAAGRLVEARACWVDYAQLVAECQSPYFASEVIRLEQRIAEVVATR